MKAEPTPFILMTRTSTGQAILAEFARAPAGRWLAEWAGPAGCEELRVECGVWRASMPGFAGRDPRQSSVGRGFAH